MIFIGASCETPPDAPSDQEVATQDLLLACSSELRRQAAALVALDAALGGLLDLWCNPDGPSGARRQLNTSLLRDLQKTDHLRQEIEGLARVLDLLVQRGASSTTISSEAIRACTALQDQQERLVRNPTSARVIASQGGAQPPAT